MSRSALLTAISAISAATPREISIASAQYRLRYLGDPVLKFAAEDVKPETDVRDLVRAMKRILVEQDGLGLAAQQVGSIYRVAIMQLRDGSFAPLATVVGINLRIIARSKKVELNVAEGCLSVQGRRGEYFRTSVRRHTWVRIAYLDEQRKEHEVRLEGADAIIAQHECDHLDGRCVADGLTRQQRRQAERIVSKAQR